jgi:bis(5'-nucleosidyl)-tetraphosphatase
MNNHGLQKVSRREFSSGGVILREGNSDFEILLIKDSYGNWTWPKGNIEKDETSEEAAIREIAEEVGLKRIKLIDRISEVRYFYRRGANLIFKTVYIYLFQTEEEEKLKVLTSEIEDAKWFTSVEALEKIDYKGAKEVLKKAIVRFKKDSSKKI